MSSLSSALPHVILRPSLKVTTIESCDAALIVDACERTCSGKAAATAAIAGGYTTSFNVAGGFEGPLDADRHRGTCGGWKAAGLPWIQS